MDKLKRIRSNLGPLLIPVSVPAVRVLVRKYAEQEERIFKEKAYGQGMCLNEINQQLP